jgi:molybdopterin-guanine dinucleotide biosynthesis protein A
VPGGASDMELYGLNMGNSEELDVYGGASFVVEPQEEFRMVSRLRRCFPEDQLPQTSKYHRNPQITSEIMGEEVRIHLYMSFKYKDKPETRVRDAVAPFVEGYHRLEQPFIHVFICHASEDKPAARNLANAMQRLGAEVWFDEWEIRVGDSIVQKINDALGKVSHLIVLLSSCSVVKPWVKKEFSSALMQQLSQKAIRVLPVRMDDCEIPPIISDIKYADARQGIEYALAEIEASLFRQ